MSVNPDAFCCRCQSDFPIGEHFRMGVLVPLNKTPVRFRRQFASWLDHEDGAYLCGNCYFDLTEDD